VPLATAVFSREENRDLANKDRLSLPDGRGSFFAMHSLVGI